MKASVGILDAGGQYVDLVQKACQRLGFAADVLPLSTPAQVLKKKYQAVIISGSPASSQEVDAPMPDPTIWQLDMPILGICYGLHAMVSQLGGEVVRGSSRQDGRVLTSVDTKHPLFKGTKPEFSALFTHGNFVSKLPIGFRTIGQHVLNDERVVYSALTRGKTIGVQFHPEVFDDTPEGYQLFKNFLTGVAGLKSSPTFLDLMVGRLVKNIRADICKKVNGRHVIAFVSGGVDSSVTAALAATEIPATNLHAYYIDNGLMRDEDDSVIDLLRSVNVPVQKIDAAEEFLSALAGVTDPQTKRQIIGKVFIDVQNKLIANLGLSEALLLQGTNAADRIESGYSKGGQNTATIKTHHNQVREVQNLKKRGLLIEPLDDLFKDEVRAVGRYLRLPGAVVDRQPFPGPGLAIRILCADQPKKHDLSDVEKAIQKTLDPKTICKLLPIRSVGVGGDERSHTRALAVQSSEPWETLASLALQLPAIFRDDLNRFIVALGDQPISQISITKTLINTESTRQLRQADSIVWQEMRNFELTKNISQFPVVLLPLSFGEAGERSVVLRPVTTSTFMTVQPMIPGKDLPLKFIQNITSRILSEVPNISQVFLDLTPKPPATTEWE